MADGIGGGGPPRRPLPMLRSSQSTIRLRRPSTSSRPGDRDRSSLPVLPAASDDALPPPPRPTAPRSRAATISAGEVANRAAGTPRETRGSLQVRQPSVLAPIPAEENEDTETTDANKEGSQDPESLESRTRESGTSSKRARRGILSRLRWRSDTNLHAAAAQSSQPGEKRPVGGDGQPFTDQHEYDDQIVNLLDAIDPEVNTLNSLTNVQNSLYAPPLGRWINRRPAYNLTRHPRVPGAFPETETIPEPPSEPQGPGEPTGRPTETAAGGPDEVRRVERIPSNMTDSFFAVRPQGISFADWSDEDLAELNDHVRHMLHSRQSAMHRRLKAFGQYVRRPLGFLITLYATLITLFGLAWVLFLIGWIYVGDEQLYVINVIDNVLVALFAIVGDGMIPWRLVDTYHMAHIARYHRLTWKLRKKMAAPKLRDKNDLPSQTVVPDDAARADVDLEGALNGSDSEVSVLTPKQQARLEHHQAKFAKSHTFYKPHETETHYAFSLRLLITIVCLLDLHSCLQLALGFTTWLIDYRTRPMGITASILSCSITVNALAGVLIMVGDRRTRKKDVVERMFRQDLTREAMKRIRKRQEEQAKKEEKKARKSLAAERDEIEGRSSLSKFRKSLEGGSSDSEGRSSFGRFRKSIEERRPDFSPLRRLSERSRQNSRGPSEDLGERK